MKEIWKFLSLMLHVVPLTIVVFLSVLLVFQLSHNRGRQEMKEYWIFLSEMTWWERLEHLGLLALFPILAFILVWLLVSPPLQDIFKVLWFEAKEAVHFR